MPVWHVTNWLGLCTAMPVLSTEIPGSTSRHAMFADLMVCQYNFLKERVALSKNVTVNMAG